MIKLINDWYNEHFNNPQVAILALLLFTSATLLYFFGDILVPLLVAVIIAYLLDGVVLTCVKYKIPRLVAIIFTFSIFVISLTVLLFILAPLLFRQGTEFILEIPGMLNKGQVILMQLPEKYPNIISEKQVIDLLTNIKGQITEFSQSFVSSSLASVGDLLTYMVYLVVVPLLIFFFLLDKKLILGWFKTFLPKDRKLVSVIWKEMNGKIASYVRGKIMEILIIWIIT